MSNFIAIFFIPALICFGFTCYWNGDSLGRQIMLEGYLFEDGLILGLIYWFYLLFPIVYFFSLIIWLSNDY